ncbi:MAG: HD domain-containing protein [Muribaculaceae bacterium]|nr:HD domain-containing protein [Muribaculaceae bacterium]
MINPNIKRYVEQEILPRYDHHDAAHRRDHALTVIEQSAAIVHMLQQQGLSVDENMAYVVAAYHDTGLCEGRERHHEVSARIIREDEHLRQWFSAEQIELMADAAEDHRASSGHEPRSLYGRIVAEADRVIDAVTIIRRTVQYGLDNYPDLDGEGQYERALAHLRQKYGVGGYLRLWLEDSPNAKRLEQLRELIACPGKLRPIFDEVYAHETAENHKTGA